MMRMWKVWLGLWLLGWGGVGQAQPSASLKPGSAKEYVAVLMWHDVVAGKKQVWFDTTVSELRAQLEEIRRRGFSVVSLDTLYRHLTEGTPLPPRPLVLTFDDNNLGLYRNAYPLLRQYHYPATFFVHTNYVGVTTDKEHCTWAQLREMQGSGLISAQPHTCSHPADMRLLSDADNLKELKNSKLALERNLGTKGDAFSYPDGRYDDRVAGLVAQAGYKIAFMEDWGNAGASKNLMQVYRYSIHRRFAQALRDVERDWQSSSLSMRKSAPAQKSRKKL